MANRNHGRAPKNVTPVFKLTVAGNEIQHNDTKGLVYAAIEDHLDMIGVCQVSLNISGLKWGGIKVGDEAEAEIGASSRKMFKGYVTGLRHAWQKGNETLTIVCMTPEIKMAASRITKVYGDAVAADQVDSDLVSTVIGRAGCTAGKVDATTPKHKYVFQRNESDLNFCKRLASRNGYILRANEGKIDFVKPQFSAAPVELDQEFLMALDYTMEPINVPPTLTVYGWDYYTKAKVEGTAGSGDVLTIGGGTNVASDNGTIWAETSYISDVLVTSQGGAKDMAVGELNRLARRFIRGRAVVQGNGDIFAGAKVKFSGLFDKFNPEVFVVSARHIIEPTRGFTTEFQFCGNTWPT